MVITIDMNKDKPKRFEGTYTYNVSKQKLPAPGVPAHKVFIVGMLRPGLGGQVVTDTFGAQHLCEATYLAGHSAMLLLKEGNGLIPDAKGPDIAGDVFKVSTDCLAAMDRLSQAMYHQRRRKVKVYDKATGEEIRAWCWFLKYPEKTTGTRLQGDYNTWALSDSVEFALRVSRAKEEYAASNGRRGNYYGTGFSPPDHSNGAVCSLPAKEEEGAGTPEDPMNLTAKTFNALRALKDGETRTIRTQQGHTVTYIKENNVLRIKETVGALITAPSEPAKEYGPPFRPYRDRGDTAADPKAPEGSFEHWLSQREEEVKEEAAEESDEAKQAKDEQSSVDAGWDKVASEMDKQREKIIDCYYCNEELFFMPDTGWVTWDSGSEKCLWGNKHKPELNDSDDTN